MILIGLEKSAEQARIELESKMEGSWPNDPHKDCVSTSRNWLRR